MESTQLPNADITFTLNCATVSNPDEGQQEHQLTLDLVEAEIKLEEFGVDELPSPKHIPMIQEWVKAQFKLVLSVSQTVQLRDEIRCLPSLQKKIGRRLAVEVPLGIRPYSLSERELKLVAYNLPRLNAIRELQFREANGQLTPARYKYLLVQKTEDEDLADKLAAQLLMSQIKSGAVK